MKDLPFGDKVSIDYTDVGKTFCCNACGKCYRFKSELERHYLVHSKVKPFQCMVCGKEFSLKGNLKAHITKFEHFC